jgi:hypothetical protein
VQGSKCIITTDFHAVCCSVHACHAESYGTCRRTLPLPVDAVWQSVPPRMRQFPNGVPASYPTVKLPTVENPLLFEKLDTESLFFAFYYQPGTYQQYLAARELKRQSWRYHKQHAAWFQVMPASCYGPCSWTPNGSTCFSSLTCPMIRGLCAMTVPFWAGQG